MPLGRKVGLGPGDIVLDGAQLPLKGARPPIFGPCLLWHLSCCWAVVCTAHRRVSLYFTMGRAFPPQNCRFPWDIWTPSNTWFPGQPASFISNRYYSPVINSQIKLRFAGYGLTSLIIQLLIGSRWQCASFVWWAKDLLLQTNHTSLQQSTVNDTRHDPKPATTQPQNPRDNNASIAEPRARACQLAEYLQRKTRLQMSGVEFGLNSHQCSQKTVVLTTTLKLIGNCVDDVITWAKAIPGAIDFRETYFYMDCAGTSVLLSSFWANRL